MIDGWRWVKCVLTGVGRAEVGELEFTSVGGDLGVEGDPIEANNAGGTESSSHRHIR